MWRVVVTPGPTLLPPRLRAVFLDRKITYPERHNLSRTAQPIQESPTGPMRLLKPNTSMRGACTLWESAGLGTVAGRYKSPARMNLRRIMARPPVHPSVRASVRACARAGALRCFAGGAGKNATKQMRVREIPIIAKICVWDPRSDEWMYRWVPKRVCRPRHPPGLLPSTRTSPGVARSTPSARSRPARAGSGRPGRAPGRPPYPRTTGRG